MVSDDVDVDTDGVGKPDPALAARGGGDRMDRQFVLFHPSRPQPEAKPRPARRRPWRGVAGPWRRLLPDHEIPGRTDKNAGRADLVQMGSLYDLVVRLRVDGRRVLSRCRTVSGRQIESRPDATAGRIVQPLQPHFGVAAL